MPRPPASPTTALGAEVQRRRQDTDLRSLGRKLGLNNSTLSRIERGTHAPSYPTAVRLATWLGWTVERVMDASSTPAASTAPIEAP